VAKAVNKLRLKHTVVTSVTRDDLDDGAAHHFAKTVNAVRQLNPETTIELLIPDFQGSRESLATVMETCPEVMNHNVETVPRLYPRVLPKSSYALSLKVLKEIKDINGKQITKSGIMLGLGEKYSEVIEVMSDLLSVGCNVLTIGQYLQPSHSHYPLARYVTPAEFEQYRHIGIQMGFCSVASGPFVRSSFNALDLFSEVKLCRSTNYST
jgi:lipoic acid synthetase